MTKSEIQKLLLTAANKEWFKKIYFEFNFPVHKYELLATGFTTIYEFVNKNYEYWEKFKGNEIDIRTNSQNYFSKFKGELDIFLTSYINVFDESSLNNYWIQSIKNRFSSNYNSHVINTFLYDKPETTFLVKILAERPEIFNGAFAFIVNDPNINLKLRNEFTGYSLACEFMINDEALFVDRREIEKNLRSKSRVELNSYLSESEANLNTHYQNTQDKFDEYVKHIDELKDEKNTLFTEWFTKTKDEDWNIFFKESNDSFSEFETSSSSKIKQLEETYRIKLKLEEPAKYWLERGETLKIEAWSSMVILIILVAASCYTLYHLLWNSPEQMLISWFQADKSAAIRWSVVYITFLSFIAFCIRAVTKVMFSSFHLARDCEERYTLTYFYLSLLKDSNVDEKDRQLIMQSLFSRAETGLLKDDSSPTMPASDTIGKFFNNDK